MALIDPRACDAIVNAMNTNDAALGLSDDMDPETRVWHLVLSLLIYCADKDLDLDSILTDAKDYQE